MSGPAAAPPPLIWLAAYPKSGSTWLRFLLHDLLLGPVPTSAALNRALPSIHDADRSLWQGAVARGGLVLTHKAAPAQLARYPAGAGVIHLVRHPVDVVLSEARYFVLQQLDEVLAREGRGPGEATPADLDRLLGVYLQVLLQRGVSPRNERLGVDRWDRHAATWAEVARALPVHRLRYEDLRARPVEALLGLLAFLGVDRDPARVQAAVDRCDVGALRRMQDREIAARQPGRFYEPRHAAAYAAGLRFVNEGAVGRGLALPAAARARLGALFGEAMASLGYRGDTPLVGPEPAPSTARLPPGTTAAALAAGGRRLRP